MLYITYMETRKEGLPVEIERRVRRFLLYSAACAAAAALVWLTARYLFWWALPFLLAAALSAAMEPLIVRMQRTVHVRRSFAAAVLTLFFLFLLGGFLSLLLSTLLREAKGLATYLPQLFSALPELLAALSARLEQSAAFPPWLLSLRDTVFAALREQSPALVAALVDRLWALLGTLASAAPQALLGAATTVLAVYFTASAWPQLCHALRRRLSSPKREKLRAVRRAAAHSLLRWLRAQGILFSLTFAQLLGGFLLLRIDFPLLLALLTALVDALPVFGTGTVLLPWALFALLFGNAPLSIALLALYLCTLLVRSLAEPRLLSAEAGLPPIASLMAMYLGWCAFGVGGMLALPLFLLFAVQIRRSLRG